MKCNAAARCFVASLILLPCAGGTLRAQSIADPSVRPASGDIVWSFDGAPGDSVRDSAGNRDDKVHGLYRLVPGVSGTALEFDGYTTHIVRPADGVPHLGNAFTVSAWIAINNYPWNWLPIVDQSEDQQVGYFLGIDAFGHVGFQAAIDGVWQKVASTRTLPLKQWAHVTGVYDGSDLSILIDGRVAGTLHAPGHFWQATSAELLIGRVRAPEQLFPAWISHPQDPALFSLDGDLDQVQVLNHAVTAEQDQASVAAAHAPSGDVLPYATLPAGTPGAGPFGAVMATLHYTPTWDRLRRIGPDSDVVVRFDRSPMRLVFWQGLNYIPAWVTENGKWYTDEFLETWGKGCPGAGDCEPMSDKQGRYSRVSIVASSPARAIIHWRYALVEAREYQGAHPDPLTGWFDWADEYWTVYPDGVAVRKQVLWSSNIHGPHEWQETIVVNGPGQRPEDNIEPDALTLENMNGDVATYHWAPKTDTLFSLPHGPDQLDRPSDANIQIVHLKSKENPFQIVWPQGLSHDTYNGEPSYSMFEWWNHWPVAQVGSSGRPAVAADRASHTSLSHIYWAPYEQTADSETKLLLCGLTSDPPASLVALAHSWLQPPAATLDNAAGAGISWDPAERAFVLHPKGPAALVIRVDATPASPLVNPAFVLEHRTGGAKVSVTAGGHPLGVSPRLGIEQHLDGDALVVYLPMQSTQPVEIRIAPGT